MVSRNFGWKMSRKVRKAEDPKKTMGKGGPSVWPVVWPWRSGSIIRSA